MIRIRVDDYPGTRPDEFYKHNWAALESFDEIMRENWVPGYMLGVIPGHVTDEDLRKMAGHPRIQVAMHGVAHDERFQNEFRDYLTTSAVKTMLEQEKSRLERLVKSEVRVYIPPHNAFDERTCAALSAVGFTTICGGPGSPAWADVTKRPFLNLEYARSQTPWEYGRSDELLQRDSVGWFTDATCAPHPVLTLHFPWEINIGLAHLRTYLSALRAAGLKFERWS